MSNGTNELAGDEALPGVSDDEALPDITEGDLGGVSGAGYAQAGKALLWRAGRKAVPALLYVDGALSAKAGVDAGIKKYKETGSVGDAVLEGGKQAVGEFTGYNDIRDALKD